MRDASRGAANPARARQLQQIPAERILLVLGEGKTRQLDARVLHHVVSALGGPERVVVETVASAAEVPRRIAERGGEMDCVAVGGGDGTLSVAAGALIETGVPLAIIPLGTANDLARTLGVPLDPVRAAELVRVGRREDIDVGEVNGRCFFNVAGIGLSVDVAGRLASMSKRWGPVQYALALAAIWRSRKPFRTEIVCDGSRTVMRSLQVSVGNGRRHGGGVTVAEDASIDDGLFDVYSLEPQPLRRMLRLAPAMLRGTHRAMTGVVNLRGRDVVVRTPGGSKPVNADGEVVTRTPARFTMHRNAVVVFLPR